MLRSKGFFWVAANHRVAYEWTQAGGVSSVNPMGTWWAAMPREDWEHADGERPDQQPSWHPRYVTRQPSYHSSGSLRYSTTHSASPS